MSGHSKWHSIKHKKAATDAKRGKIFTKLTEYQVDEERLEILKETYVRGLENFRMEQPHSHAKYYNDALLAQRMWTKEELLSCVGDITASKIQSFISDMFSNIHIECSMFGNLTPSKALEYIHFSEGILVKGFDSKPLPQYQCTKDSEYFLNNGTSAFQTITNYFHKTSCIENIYQVGVQNTRDNICLLYTSDAADE